jgi:hypothetical protein
LGWPGPDEAFEPSGAGARVYAEFARKTIQGAMRIAHPGVEVNVGLVAADPKSDSSEAPLALLCEFPRAAEDKVLDLAHRLAWNFSRTALLVTMEPHRIVAWSCYQDPSQPENQRRVRELPTPDGFRPEGTKPQRDLRDLLHWVNLITNRAQRDLPKHFPADGRADALLLKNLRYVRSELLEMGLAQDHCHDLLARVIFTQFLFHRKDSGGHAFFSKQKMQRLHDEEILSRAHHDLASVLSHKPDTYSLFRWMDDRFNGDLFPGKDGDDDNERESVWRTERTAVSKDHLNLLAGLIRGDLDVADKQHTLWPYYSFDSIPLEFISSVYEEFLTAEERGNDKAYYTPSHLVDYVLDAVLPWNSENWDVRILDPCCGSAIFLVKAFQRLIHRWRRAHPGKDPLVTDLRPILENNLVGMDKNREAVRVACFSLYLAMADAIEPKHYVTRENVKVFPRLRGTRLIHRDFFAEAPVVTDVERFDCVLGNAPWGDGSILADRRRDEKAAEFRKRIAALPPTPAQQWAKKNEWPVANKDVGPLFLAKAATLVKSDGFVAMVNTASLLYWRDGEAVKLRKKLFTSFTFAEITNLSALRRELFTQAIGPACILVFGPAEPDKQQPLRYYTPKPVRLLKLGRDKPSGGRAFSIEPHDISVISHLQASEVPWTWSALAAGGSRHFSLVQRLVSYPTLEKLESTKNVETRKGIIAGNRAKAVTKLQKRRFLESEQFPTDAFIHLDAKRVPIVNEIRVDTGHGIRDLGAFKNPQLLIKQSLVTKLARFRAVLVKSDNPEWGVICKETYVSVHDLSANSAHINSACAVYNSKFAVAFFALTSGSFPHYISKMSVGELLKLPLPQEAPNISNLNSFDAIDKATRKMFGLTSADWTLIEDFLEYTLPDALRKTPGPARFPTKRNDEDGSKEPELTQYAKTFARVVQGTFGKDKAVASTIYTEQNAKKLPVRMITIHLDAPHRGGVKTEHVETDGLLDELAKFHVENLKQTTRDATGRGLGFQRIAYLFHPARENGSRVMNLTIVKPDECRYWTRSMAMRDADQLATAIRKAYSPRNTPA